ncbi:MAG TPA: hypothetical protein VF669_23120 [Tepidisphaeraceae bacterium]|jgi:hypothetical protein
MPDPVYNILILVNRYLHIVCTTLLVGGTLFYEMVVPAAIGELKPEQQLSVFARARWFFKGIVWVSAVLLIISGIVSAYRNFNYYTGPDQLIPRVPFAPASEGVEHSAWLKAGWWWAAHASCGLLSVIISLFLVYSAKPPAHPIPWMRLNLVILLIVIFLGSATRHVRRLHEQTGQNIYLNLMAPD